MHRRGDRLHRTHVSPWRHIARPQLAGAAARGRARPVWSRTPPATHVWAVQALRCRRLLAATGTRGTNVQTPKLRAGLVIDFEIYIFAAASAILATRTAGAVPASHRAASCCGRDGPASRL